MKTCVIIDDEHSVVKLLKKYIADRNDILCVNSFTNAQDAISYLQDNPIDIIFLDIDMPVSGLKFRKLMPGECMIIFTSTSPEYALEAFNQNAVDYILKPVLPERLHQAINKALMILNPHVTSFNEIKKTQVVLTLKTNKKIHKIAADDLIYIESLREYICYYTKTNKMIALGALKDVYKGLPQNDFIRIHKSYIINKKFIAHYNFNSVTLINNVTLNIGRMYKQNFNDALKNIVTDDNKND